MFQFYQSKDDALLLVALYKLIIDTDKTKQTSNYYLDWDVNYVTKIRKYQCLKNYPVNNASRVQVSDATENLVEQVGHPLMVQVHVDHLTEAGIHQLHH